MSGRIWVPMHTEPFRQFQRGEKTVEVRALDSPVARQVLAHDEGYPVHLRRGYSTPDELHGRLGLWATAPCFAALPVSFRVGAAVKEPGRFFDPDEPVLAFQVLDLPLQPLTNVEPPEDEATSIHYDEESKSPRTGGEM